MAKEAPACRKALTDATKKWPNRSRASDGILPSAAHHKQNPTSDHETGQAYDLTHDPKNGVDGNLLVANLINSKDPRVKYIIWNRQIWFPTARGNRPKGWSKYTGKNPHDHHFHVSIKPESRDDLSPWPWSPEKEVEKLFQQPVLKVGDRGEAVKGLQSLLKIKVDGDFGKATDAAVKAFQTENKLKADGIVGVFTWNLLLKRK